MNEHDEETEEEHAVRLRKISEEIKAEMKAGTFNFKGTVTGRVTTYEPSEQRLQFKEILPEEIYVFDYDSEIYPPVSERQEFRQAVHSLFQKYIEKHPIIVFDECHHIKPQDYWLGYDTRREKDWDRKEFKSNGPTPPSEAVRLKLRAKRKARKK